MQDELQGLLDTVDLKGVSRGAGKFNPATGLLTEVLDPPALNHPDPSLVIGPERSKNFQNWFGDSKAVDDRGNPLTLYHGTTHDFKSFDADTGNKDNYFGRGIYLTSSPDDASANYGATGSDLKARIELRADQIQSEIGDAGRGYPQGYFNDLARYELMGPAERVIPVHASLENPVIISKNPEREKQYIDFEKMFDVEERPNPDDYETDDEYYAAEEEWYIDEYDQMFQGIEDKLRAAFYRSDDEANYKWADFKDKVVVPLFDEISENGGSITPEGIDYIIRQNADKADHMDVGETIKEVYKELGFDGIIMDASSYFPNMEFIEDSKHYIIFDPTKVKGLFNRGTYNPEDPDYLSRRLQKGGLLSG